MARRSDREPSCSPAGWSTGAPTLRASRTRGGTTVFHCPFCHGWEVRDAPLAVVGAGERLVHSALMLRGWSDDVVVLGDGTPELTDAQRDLLGAAGIRVDNRPIAAYASKDGALTAIEFADGESLPRRAALVAATLHQRSRLVAQLGVDTAAPPLSAEAVVVDPFQRTSAHGVFAAGDLSAGMPQVAAAIASGSLAGTAVMQYLMAGDVGLPVPPWPIEKVKADA